MYTEHKNIGTLNKYFSVKQNILKKLPSHSTSLWEASHWLSEGSLHLWKLDRLAREELADLKAVSLKVQFSFYISVSCLKFIHFSQPCALTQLLSNTWLWQIRHFSSSIFDYGLWSKALILSSFNLKQSQLTKSKKKYIIQLARKWIFTWSKWHSLPTCWS